MRDVPFSDFYKIKEEAKEAINYLLKHYKEIRSLEAKYFLYGADDVGIGVARPGSRNPTINRELKTKTKRRIYLEYCVDSDYKLLRINRYIDGKITSVRYRVIVNDRMYFVRVTCHPSVPPMIDTDVYMVHNVEGDIPREYAHISTDKIIHPVYIDPISSGKMGVTYYTFYNVDTYKDIGFMFDPDAPYGDIKCQARRYYEEEDLVYTDFKKVCKEFFEGEGTNVDDKSVKTPTNTIATWIDEILKKDIPHEVEAFCFNLYDEGTNNDWSMELVGSETFDENNPDWPCFEATDFESRETPYKWELEGDWEQVLNYAKKAIGEYLDNGKYAHVLKSKKGVGIGFVDGDLSIIYKKQHKNR